MDFELIKAALRYWADEMEPHSSEAAHVYFENPDDSVSPFSARQLLARLKGQVVGHLSVSTANEEHDLAKIQVVRPNDWTIVPRVDPGNYTILLDSS